MRRRHGPGGARYERLAEWREGDEARSARTFYVGAYERTVMEDDPEVASVERTRLPGGVVHVRTTPAEGAATEAFEYRHLDHLGSASAVSDASGALLDVLGHDPFGGRRAADWTRALDGGESAALSGRRTARGFTGHEQLDRTGLVHMGGRLYDPQLGRFLSPDPYVADPTMGQDWNAYSYVANSPMSYLDPTGHVRTGPMCSLAVRCAADDSGGHPGGGFTRTAQAYQASASFLLSVPVLTVDWGFVGGFGPGFGRGSDYGRAAWAPQVRLGFATYPVSFAVPGSLRVDGENPADEPMTPGLGAGAVGVAALQAGGVADAQAQDDPELREAIQRAVSATRRYVREANDSYIANLRGLHLHRNLRFGSVIRRRRDGSYTHTTPDTNVPYGAEYEADGCVGGVMVLTDASAVVIAHPPHHTDREITSNQDHYNELSRNIGGGPVVVSSTRQGSRRQWEYREGHEPVRIR